MSDVEMKTASSADDAEPEAEERKVFCAKLKPEGEEKMYVAMGREQLGEVMAVLALKPGLEAEGGLFEKVVDELYHKQIRSEKQFVALRSIREGLAGSVRTLSELRDLHNEWHAEGDNKVFDTVLHTLGAVLKGLYALVLKRNSKLAQLKGEGVDPDGYLEEFQMMVVASEANLSTLSDKTAVAAVKASVASLKAVAASLDPLECTVCNKPFAEQELLAPEDDSGVVFSPGCLHLVHRECFHKAADATHLDEDAPGGIAKGKTVGCVVNDCPCALSGQWLSQLAAAQRRCGDKIADENVSQQIKKRKLEKQEDQLASNELGEMPDGANQVVFAQWLQKAVGKKQLIYFEHRSVDDKLYMCWTPRNGWNTVGKAWFGGKDSLIKAKLTWIGRIVPEDDRAAEEKKFQTKYDKKARFQSAYCRPKPKGKAPAK